MTDSTPPPVKPQRAPKQTRGHERVMAILDACARLLLSHGVANLTMHGIAREAGTSIGSLYHFFADKQQVLDALGQRHIVAVSHITEPLLAVDAQQWREMSCRGVIERMILPILHYLEQHPDLLQMINPGFATGQLQAPELHARVKSVYEQIFSLRLPQASAEQRATYVLAMFGLPMGLFQLAQEHSQLKHVLLLQEAPRAMEAYLEAIERQHRNA